LIFHVFLNASDFTSESNEWEYSVDCPKDSLDCMDTRTTNYFGWFMVLFVILTFLLRDLANALMLLYQSIASYDIQCLFASLVLMFITVLTIFTSFVINYATGLSNAQILKDSALLLFLSDIDEALFSAIKVIYPGWVENLSTESSASSSNISSINPQQDTSELPINNAQLREQFETFLSRIQQDYNKVQEKLKIEIKKRHNLEIEIKEMHSQINDLTKIIAMKS